MRYFVCGLLVLTLFVTPFSTHGAEQVIEPDQTPGTVAQVALPSTFIEQGLVAQSVLEPINGGWNGIAIADLSQVPGMNRPAVFMASGSGGSFRRAIDPRNGQVIWSATPSPVSQECGFNINTSVTVVGRYIVVGQNSYSMMWGSTALNGIGRVCVYDALTGAFLNQTPGFFGGELFGTSIVPIRDAQNPNTPYVAISAPRRWSTAHNTVLGAVDIYRISDIVAQGINAYPIHTIEGVWSEWSLNYSSYISCNSYEFGAAIANVGDINNDGIDDIAVTDPGFCMVAQGGLTRDFVGLFDSRRNAQGQFVMSKRVFLNEIGYFWSRFGQAVAAIKDPRGLRLFVSAIGGVAVLTFNPSSGLTRSLTLSDPAPSSTQTLDPSATWWASTSTHTRFGWRLKNIGDTDGDNVPDLAITAPLRDGQSSSEWYAGAVYVISGDWFFRGGRPSFRMFSPNGANNRLGYGHDSVAGIPDINGDGKSDMVASAMNGGMYGGGATYVLSH